jgi:hypothetical protein
MTMHATIQTHESPRRNATSFARHLPTAARVLMGLLFFASGLFGILIAAGLVPLPQPTAPPPEGATAFLEATMKTGYLFPLIKGTKAVVGALLLSNRFVPLALAVIAPVVVNILAFHAFLAPSGVGVAGVVLALEVYLAWAYRETYRPLLAPRATASTK